MSNLEKILENTLKKVGGIEPATLGKTESLKVSKEDKKRLILQLEEEAKFNNRMIIAIIILHFLLFALAVFLVLYYRDSPEKINFVLGGSVLSLMVIMYSLIRLWKVKVANDNLRAILPNLSPEQAMVVVQSIYFEEKKK